MVGARCPPSPEAGYRVVTYDRRGFGASDKPGDASSYDYDTLTGDLDALMTELDLQDATLVGFSMGGGEVARYVGTHGEDRVHSVVFAAAIPPCLMHDDDHPDGALDHDTVRGIQAGARGRPARLPRRVHPNFFSADGELRSPRRSSRRRSASRPQADVHAAASASARGSPTSPATWQVTVPTLVIHGDSDAIVPFESPGQRTHEPVTGSELDVVEGGPHGINTSHTEEFNAAAGVPPARSPGQAKSSGV